MALASAFICGGLASPANAAPELNAKLVHCGTQSCLRVAGHRDDPDVVVGINGHAVPVEGNRNWQAVLPVEVVRAWSPPYARTIEVSLQDPQTRRESAATVDLPIGLLGVANLTSLVVSVR